MNSRALMVSRHTNWNVGCVVDSANRLALAAESSPRAPQEAGTGDPNFGRPVLWELSGKEFILDRYASGIEINSCPHCGVDMRRGMIRCRECGQSAKEVDGDFELTGHILLPNLDPKCLRCGSVLEADAADCAVCTSRMLDQMMSGPPPAAHLPSPHASPRRQMSVMEQHVRQAAQRGLSESEGLVESDTIANASPTAVRLRPSAPATAKGAAATQPANHSKHSRSDPQKDQAPAVRD